MQKFYFSSLRYIIFCMSPHLNICWWFIYLFYWVRWITSKSKKKYKKKNVETKLQEKVTLTITTGFCGLTNVCFGLRNLYEKIKTNCNSTVYWNREGKYLSETRDLDNGNMGKFPNDKICIEWQRCYFECNWTIKIVMFTINAHIELITCITDFALLRTL